MNSEKICEELISIADSKLKQIEKILPDDPIQSFILFTETLRVSDYLGVVQNIDPKNTGISFQVLDIMRMGWNLAAYYLVKPLDVKGFPIRESTETTQSHAAALLYQFGSTSLLRRAAHMVKSGILSVEKNGNTFIFHKTEIADTQFLDQMEFSYLNRLEGDINNNAEKFYSGWNLVGYESLDKIFSKPGNFMSLKNIKKDKLYDFILPEIDSIMMPLIHPWDSGHGIMMKYGSTIEIDHHFLAKATELIKIWRDEAGWHPEVKLGDITGGDIAGIVLLIVSLHLKHVHFASLASKKYPQISIPQSLTIWEPLDELKKGIIEFTGFDSMLVSKVFDAIMMNVEDVKVLKNYTSRFMPLIINMGNGFVLRPVSSVIRNPFFSIISLLEHRNPNFRHDISSPREKWLRTHLYALFTGTRYQTVEGNINLRHGNFVITDIDAAIYDNLTGELALFQIKWQDFFFNDVKKLRSKASNLTKEMDNWTEKVTDWIKLKGPKKLGKCLRLKSGTENFISSIYLFGVSRNVVRMQGYGFTVSNNNLAIANWPQFVRLRFEIGPADRVISKLFEILKDQMHKNTSPKPLPVEVIVSDYVMKFEDLWSTIED